MLSKSGLYVVVVIFNVSLPQIALRESWLEADPDIETPLVDYLAQQKLDVAKWRKLSPEDRSELLIDLKADYPGPGKWVAGWTAVLKNAAGKQLPRLDE